MINIAHIHPMLVHFPLALTPVAVAIQLYVVFVRGDELFAKGCAQATAVGLLALAAIAALAAAVFGDMALDAAVDAGVSQNILEGHEQLGSTSAFVITLLAAIEIFLYRRHLTLASIKNVSVVAGVVMVVLLLITAYYGGNLVYEHGVNVAHLPEKAATATGSVTGTP